MKYGGGIEEDAHFVSAEANRIETGGLICVFFY